MPRRWQRDFAQAVSDTLRSPRHGSPQSSLAAPPSSSAGGRGGQTPFIRADLERACKKARLPAVPAAAARWCGDNGAMIGAQGYYEYLAGHTAGMDLNAYATRDISE